jgi:hypothetical protein
MMSQPKDILQREYTKFVESPTRPNNSAVEVVDAYGEVSFTGSLRVDQASSTIIYLGQALFGALDSEAKWQIKKIDLSSGVSIKNASDSFDQIWNNRASLTYV